LVAAELPSTIFFSAQKCGLKILALCDLDSKKAVRYAEAYNLGDETKIYQDYKK